MRALLIALAVSLVALAACDSGGPTPEPVALRTDFSEGAGGWYALFTNYPRGEEAFYEIESGVRPLPAPLANGGAGYYLSANNHSDDINMHLVRLVSGLVAGATYEVEFAVTFATSVPAGCFGVGGAPGEAVTVHAAALSTEPELASDGYTLRVVESYVETGAFDSWYRAFRLGDITNGQDCEEVNGVGTFALKTLRSSTDHAVVRADGGGRAWLLVGTRSGFEDRTDLYYTHIEATLQPE